MLIDRFFFCIFQSNVVSLFKEVLVGDKGERVILYQIVTKGKIFALSKAEGESLEEKIHRLAKATVDEEDGLMITGIAIDTLLIKETMVRREEVFH